MELTLAVVGIDFLNADGSNRLSEAMMMLPGASVELVAVSDDRAQPFRHYGAQRSDLIAISSGQSV